MDIDPGCSNTQPNNPSRQTRTNNNLTKGRRGIPLPSLPNSPEPLQPGETAATTTWHYKYNNAALFGNVKACNL